MWQGGFIIVLVLGFIILDAQRGAQLLCGEQKGIITFRGEYYYGGHTGVIFYCMGHKGNIITVLGHKKGHYYHKE